MVSSCAGTVSGSRTRSNPPGAHRAWQAPLNRGALRFWARSYRPFHERHRIATLLGDAGAARAIPRPADASYGEYLKIDELLALQRPLSEGPEHDEMLFIVIHQVYELWFKEILHELDYLEGLLRGTTAPARATRSSAILTILKVHGRPARHPGDHDAARVPLLPRPARVRQRVPVPPVPRARVRAGLEGPEGAGAVSRRERDPAPPGAAAGGAPRCGTPSCGTSRPTASPVPRADLERDVTRRVEPSPGLQDAWSRSIAHHPVLAELCERLVDLDEGLMEWRYRHVKMVQRTIGTRRGTGGSAGAEYLMTTLNQPLFPDLWAIRTEL